MQNGSDGRHRLTLAIRWTARAWAIVSIGLILLLSIGQLPSNRSEWIGFVLYPAGIVAGMILAWWREGLGGTITVGSLVAFYVLHLATAGTLPKGSAWLILAAPGLLFLWCWRRSQPARAAAA
jgi:hypothetical protein